MKKFALILWIFVGILLLIIICVPKDSENELTSNGKSFSKSDFKTLKTIFNSGQTMHVLEIPRKLDTVVISNYCKSSGGWAYYIYIKSEKKLPYFPKIDNASELMEAVSIIPPDYVYFNDLGGYFTMQPD